MSPIYRVKCLKCGHEVDKWSKINSRHRIRCEKCGGKTKLIFTAINLIPELEPHWDNGLGEVVKTRKQKKELLKKKGLTQL
ncbi:MAG: FmdB family zinc ribbon protein [Bacillota bacterium]